MKRVLLAVLLAMAALSVLSCSGGGGYRTMSMKEGVHGFTFEYPQGYELVHLDLENTPNARYTAVGLSRGYGGSYSEFYVYIWDGGTQLQTPESLMDSLLRRAAASMAGYYLIEQSSTLVNDTIATRAVFAADAAIPTSDNATPAPRPATYRVTLMTFSTLAVEIDQTCDTSVADITNEDYQHLLQTFALLD